MAKHIRIYDLDMEYEVDYRNIKYPRIEFKTGRLFLVLPKNYEEASELIEKHKEWIYEKSLAIEAARNSAKDIEIESKSESELKNFVNALVEKFSNETKVGSKEIHFRELKSKWGSCSVKGRLTFNLLLRYLPNDLIEYVVFHEVLHLKERNHNERFWNIISSRFENWQEKEKELLVYWFLTQDLIRKEH
jgi:hypothetical protein